MEQRLSDFERLREFVQRGDQLAFAAIVRRHVDLVYATALRKAGDAGAAEEVTQNVFAALARKAWRFAPEASLPAWLHRTTLLEAKQWLRGELRRRRREQTAAELGTTMNTPDERAVLLELVPLLDDALLSLREKDRTALLLRYYENQSLSEVGAVVGVGEDAARKRVQGALEKISQFFQRRGFRTATVAVSAAALERTAVAAPATTASIVVNTALQAAPHTIGGLAALLVRFAGSTLAQKVALFVAIAAALLIGLWIMKQKVEMADRLRRPQGESTQTVFLRPREFPTQPVLGLADAAPLISLSRNDIIPPFVAEGHLLTQEFRTERTNLNYKTEANVVFLYSNGWWQAEVQYLNPGTGPSIHNCMRIPDGTRYYRLFWGSTRPPVETPAFAWVLPFPPPGKTEMLVTWLSLCPRPELPLIDSKRMRRFINLPDCRTDIFNLPQNEGYYGVNFLNPGNAFVSDLTITNNGFGIEYNVMKSGDVEGEISRFAGAFENGFKELEYNVLESTNFNGVAFPVRAVYHRFSPNWGDKRNGNLRVNLVSELTIKRITFSESEVSRRRSAQSELSAYDLRAPDLPRNEALRYKVTDDQWKPLSDQEIQSGFQKLRQAGN